MAHYPEISAIDFSLRVENGRTFQNPVRVPKYAYQHTGNFDFYQPSAHDFLPCEGPGPERFVLRKGLAYSLWETVQMKVKYILAAAHNWNGQVDTHPLPTTLPEAKVTELGMPPPPFPDSTLLSINLFLADEDPEVIRNWVYLWQGISLSLSAWITKARLNSLSAANCTWVWPHSPFDINPAVDHGDTDSNDTDSLSSLFTPNDHSSHPLVPGTPTTSSVPATSLSATADPRVPKRARSASPDLVKEPKPEDMQLVLWQPSPLQLLTRETALREGEVRAVANQPVLPPTPVNTPAVQVTAPAPVEQTPTITAEDDIPILILDNHAPAPVPVVHDPVPTTEEPVPGPSTVTRVFNRPMRPLPLRATHVSSHEHLVFEYESRSEVQENRGRFGYA